MELGALPPAACVNVALGGAVRPCIGKLPQCQKAIFRPVNTQGVQSNALVGCNVEILLLARNRPGFVDQSMVGGMGWML